MFKKSSDILKQQIICLGFWIKNFQLKFDAILIFWINLKQQLNGFDRFMHQNQQKKMVLRIFPLIGIKTFFLNIFSNLYEIFFKFYTYFFFHSLHYFYNKVNKQTKWKSLLKSGEKAQMCYEKWSLKVERI